MWASLTKKEVEEDLSHPKFNSIRLFKLSEWGSDKMKKVWMDLTGKDLPLEYNGEIIEERIK